jgi:drug/metabolite transporter (DMT)-like permease
MLRLLIGATLLGTVVVAARESLPRSVRAYAHLSVLGFVGIALPFCLITAAETRVDSALAAVLTAPVPLFVILFAALLLPDEGLTANKLLGVSVGLAGVAVLVGFDPVRLASGDLWAEIALLGAAVSYGIAGVYARRFVTGYRPMIPALFEVTTALVMVGALAFIFEQPLQTALPLNALFAVTWLGLFGSGLAFLVFFRLLGRWGAGRTSLVAYLLPVWGIVLGALVLGEHIPDRILIGTALVIGGIALVNMSRGSIMAAADGLGDRLRGRFGRQPSPDTPAADPASGPR